MAFCYNVAGRWTEVRLNAKGKARKETEKMDRKLTIAPCLDMIN